MIPLALIGESILIAIGILGLAFFFMWRMAKGGGNDGGLLSLPAKLFLTAALLAVLGYTFYQGRGNRGAAAVALFTILLVAFPLVVMWLPQLVEAVLSPFFGSLTGGNERIEPKPMYFRAIGLRKRGEYAAAIEAAETELARFADDVEGLLLIADIRSTDLRDPVGALGLLEVAVLDPKRAPASVAVLLSHIADLQLNKLNNPDAARGSLRRIVAEFPGTDAAVLAQQRLAHLPDEQQLLERAERPKFVVQHHEARLGLDEPAAPNGSDRDSALERAAELVRHLTEFPDDWERREALAQLYGTALGHPELATAELEQLIGHPDAQPRHVARWLNELADLQLKSPAGADAAKPTLERIVNDFPGTPWAEQATSRIRLLGLDRRGKEATRTLKLGTYERNLGLKRNDADGSDPAAGKTPE